MKQLKETFRSNGYPTNIIARVLNPKPKPKMIGPENQPLTTVYIPYIGATSDKIRRICSHYNIRTVFDSKDTIKSRLCKTAPKWPTPRTKNCVYEIPSQPPCNMVYIGQTKRALEVRLAEHKRNIKNGDTVSSTLAEHCWSHHHSMDWENAKVVAIERNWKKRELRETMEMKRRGKNVYSKPSAELNDIWTPLILNKHQ